MRITLLNQYYAPDEAATAQILSDLGAALAARGHEVTAICCDRSYADPKRLYPVRETIDNVRVVRVRSTGFGRSNPLGRVTDYATYYLGTALRLLFGRRPDAIIALTTPPMIALLASTLGHLRGTPTIFWSMDVYPDIAYELGAIRPASVAGRLFALLSRKTLQNADCTVALGETMAQHLARGGARRVEVVHNWPPADELRIENGELRERSDASTHSRSSSPDSRFSILNSQFVVMYSGNMGLAHEFDTVLDAAARMQKERARVLFRFVGGGPRRREVENLAAGLALTNVTFNAYVPRSRLAESLASPDVHLVTLRERMPGLLVPSKIYGILAAAKPVVYVGPAAGEIYDIVREGDCGVHIEIGDVDGLVAALQRYVSDRELVLHHGRNARVIYEQRFTREQSLGRYVQIVEQLQAPTASARE